MHTSTLVYFNAVVQIIMATNSSIYTVMFQGLSRVCITVEEQIARAGHYAHAYARVGRKWYRECRDARRRWPLKSSIY